jgi:hypothetical protein
LGNVNLANAQNTTWQTSSNSNFTGPLGLDANASIGVNADGPYFIFDAGPDGIAYDRTNNNVNFVINNANVARLTTGRLSLPGGGNFYLDWSGSNPLLNVDANDYYYYDRSGNQHVFAVGGTDYFWVNTVGAGVHGRFISDDTVAVNSSQPQFFLNKAASGQQNLIYGQTNGSNRWIISIGDWAAEGGGNAGSNFQISRYSDAGAGIDSPLQINRASGLVQIADGLSAGNYIQVTNGATASFLYLDTSAGQFRGLVFRTGTVNRWQFYADNSAESGGNAGATLHLDALSDAGGFIANVFQAVRATAQLFIPKPVLGNTGSIAGPNASNVSPGATISVGNISVACAVGDMVVVGHTGSTLAVGLSVYAFVNGTNSVGVRISNVGAATATTPSGWTIYVMVFPHG